MDWVSYYLYHYFHYTLTSGYGALSGVVAIIAMRMFRRGLIRSGTIGFGYVLTVRESLLAALYLSGAVIFWPLYLTVASLVIIGRIIAAPVILPPRRGVVSREEQVTFSREELENEVKAALAEGNQNTRKDMIEFVSPTEDRNRKLEQAQRLETVVRQISEKKVKEAAAKVKATTTPIIPPTDK